MGQEAHAKKAKKEEKDEEVSNQQILVTSTERCARLRDRQATLDM